LQSPPHDGAPCARCGARMRARNCDAVAITAALVCAAFIMLFPANIYPMNSSDLLGKQLEYTNFGYVLQLWHLGLWPLGAVTFWTSILNPALMLICLGWCVVAVWRRSGRRLVLRHLSSRGAEGCLEQTGNHLVAGFVRVNAVIREVGPECAGRRRQVRVVIDELDAAAARPGIPAQPVVQTADLFR